MAGSAPQRAEGRGQLRPTWRAWTIIVLAALTLTFRAVDVAQNSAGRILELGYEARATDAGVVLARSAMVSVAPAAAGQLLRDGDILRAVTVRGVRTPVVAVTQLYDTLRPLHTGELWVAHVDRPGVGAIDITLPAVTSPWPVRTIEIAIPLMFTVVTVVTGLLLIGLRPSDRVVHLGALLFVCLSYIVGTPLQGLPSPARQVAAVLQALCTSALPFLLLRFFALFPAPGWLDRRARWLFPVLGTITVIAAAASMLELLRYVDAQPAWLPLTMPRALAVAWLVVYVSMIAGGIASLVAQYRSARTPSDRRRLGIIVAGVVGGLGPLCIYLIAAALLRPQEGGGWFAAAVVAVLCLPLFPALFAYAVIRHRVLGVDAMVRRGAQYLLVSRGLLLLEGIVVFTVLFVGARWLGATAFAGADPAMLTVAVIGLTTLVLLAVSRANRQVQLVIDRFFFRDAYEPERVLSALAVDVKRLAVDANAVLTHVAEVIGRTLRTSASGAVTLPGAFGDVQDFRLAVMRAFGAEARDIARARDLTTRVGRLLDNEAFVAWLQRQRAGTALALDPLAPPPWGAMDDPDDGWTPALIAPLVADAGVAGALLFDEKLSEEPFSRRDRALIATAASQAAIALDYGRLIEQAAAQEAVRRDLEVAQQVQSHLFPRRPPEVRGFEFSGVCRPARTIGGDYYDAVALQSTRLAVAVGDVVGKGVGAALLMSHLQATLRVLLRRATNLSEVAAEVNHAVQAATEPGKFVTLFVGVLDRQAEKLWYVNAGHNPPLLRRMGGRLEALQPTGMAIALSARATFETRAVPFRQGDTLLVFTDGVTEAMRTDNELYGDERLAALFARVGGSAADSVRDALLADVDAFVAGAMPSDDLTVVVVRAV